MKKLNLFILLVAVVLLSGCTEQERAKSFGGTATENLPPGQKFQHVAWEGDHLWIVTRPMHPDEKAEIYTVKESSSYGVIQGKIVIVEHSN